MKTKITDRGIEHAVGKATSLEVEGKLIVEGVDVLEALKGHASNQSVVVAKPTACELTGTVKDLQDAVKTLADQLASLKKECEVKKSCECPPHKEEQPQQEVSHVASPEHVVVADEEDHPVVTPQAKKSTSKK